MKRFAIGLLGFLLNVSPVRAKEHAAVLNLYTEGVFASPELASDLLRIEMEKLDVYLLLDRFDVQEVLARKEGLSMQECYGALCMHEVGQALDVEHVISGSALNAGNKIIVTLKELNTSTGKIEKTQVTEFVKLEKELQVMLRLSVQEMYGFEREKEEVERLIWFEEPKMTPEMTINNRGPRIGFAYLGGERGNRLMASEDLGGFDVHVPIYSQFGYQIEKSYVSSGNFSALIEGLFMVSGVEKGLFIPSLTILNGFRSENTGWEIGFGPTFGLIAKREVPVDAEGNIIPESQVIDSLEYDTRRVIHNRGEVSVNPGWVWAIGRTFRSGYLNIPVNLYTSYGKDGYFVGASIGFNIQKEGRRKP